MTEGNILNKSVFKSAKETTYNVTTTQRDYRYTPRGWRDYGDPNRIQTSQKTITTEPSLSTNWRSQAVSDQLGRDEYKTISISTNTTTALNMSRGYNIRCIKEE